MPNIGLKPKAPTAIPDRLQWLRGQKPKLSSDLSSKLVALWSDLDCGDINKSEFAESGDRARQCLRLPSAAAQPPAAVDAWHVEFLGLPTLQADALLKE